MVPGGVVAGRRSSFRMSAVEARKKVEEAPHAAGGGSGVVLIIIVDGRDWCVQSGEGF